MESDSPSAQDGAEPVAQPSGPIVARAGTYYRVTRYLMTVILIAYGLWSLYDGFINWPRWPQTHPKEMPYTATDILFNKVLGIILPPLGLLVLIRSLRNSRGQYRLEENVLNVPGHPPVPLNKIVDVDKELWERKGIAYVNYQLEPSGARETIKLDDFVYERDPTDAIYEQVLAAAQANMMKAAPKPAIPAAQRGKPLPRPGLVPRTGPTARGTPPGAPPSGLPPTPPPPKSKPASPAADR